MANIPSDFLMGKLANDCFGPCRESSFNLAINLAQVLIGCLYSIRQARAALLKQSVRFVAEVFSRRPRIRQNDKNIFGKEVLRDIKCCNTFSEVNGRIDNWTAILDVHGGELFGATKTLRSMVDIIQEEF